MSHALSHRAAVHPAHPRSTSLHYRHLDARQEQLLIERRRERDEHNRSVILTGLISLAAFALVAGMSAFLLFRDHAQKEAEHAALLARQASLRNELLAPSTLRPQSAAALLRRIDETRSEWVVGPDADAILRQADEARKLIAEQRVREALAGELSALQREFDADGKNVDAWRRLHERSRSLEARVRKGDSELQTQVAALVERADAGWFQALLTAGTADGIEPRAGLRDLVTAEDLGADRLDAARKDHPAQQRWRDRLRKLTPAFDAAQKAVYTDAVVAATPWQDLVPPESAWVASRGENFTRQAGRDGLRLTCARTERPQSGIVVLQHENWHACALSFDVRLDSGSAIVFGRAREQFGERAAGGLHLTTTPVNRSDAVTLPAGKDVHVELTVIGGRATAEVATYPPRHVELQITHDERRGTFAVLAHPDTVLVIRNLRVRRLG